MNDIVMIAEYLEKSVKIYEVCRDKDSPFAHDEIFRAVLRDMIGKLIDELQAKL